MPGALVLAVAALSISTATGVLASRVPLLHAPVPARRGAADSLADLKRARAAQERFERTRRHRLPSQSSRSACEVAIGRFCYWYDPAEPQAPDEPPRIARDREALVALLDTLAARRPGDEWIAGQRVRYLLESARPDEALAAAARCAAPSWWCAALRGLALHESGRFAPAAAVYDSVLAAMTDAQRCAWRDIGPLIAGSFAAGYRAAGCSRRHELARRFWWMARPFHSSDANDLETEHLARRTWSRLLRDARNPHGFWGADQAAMALRYGWPIAWSRDRFREAGSAAAGTEHVRGHEAAPSWAWLPAPRALARPYDATATDWTLDSREAVARYAPRGLRSLTAVPHQLARFRRGDSLLVAVIYDVGADTALGGAELDVALALSADEHSPPRLARTRTRATTGAVQLAASAEPQLLSLEIRAAGGHAAARTRRGVRPLPAASTVVLSDILLLAPFGEVPADLSEALPLALATDTIATGAALGMFWETYALTAAGARPANVSVRLSRVRASAGRRIAETLRLEERPVPVAVRWETDARRPLEGSAGAATASSTAFTLDLSRRPPGLYRIELSVTAADGAVARRARDIRITGALRSPVAASAVNRPQAPPPR